MALSITTLSGFGGLASQGPPPVVAPTYIGTSYFDGGSGTFYYPTGPQSGDLIVCQTISAGGTQATLSNFTQAASLYWPGYSYYSQLWYRSITGETSQTITDVNGGGQMIMFRGATFGTYAVGAESAAPTVDSPSITTTRDNSIVVTFACDRDPAPGSLSYSTGGWTLRAENKITYFSLGVGTRLYATSGTSTGVVTWNAVPGSYAATAMTAEVKGV